jgi:comEA protein
VFSAFSIIALAKSFWHYQPMLRRRYSVTRILFAIFAFVLAAVPASLAKKKPPAHPINLNTATATDLQQVPGIGPSTAQKILDTRKSYGAFKSVDDLLAIKGIGPKKLEKMRKYLTVGKPPSKNNPAPPKPPPLPPNLRPQNPPQKNPPSRQQPLAKTKNRRTVCLALVHHFSNFFRGELRATLSS